VRTDASTAAVRIVLLGAGVQGCSWSRWYPRQCVWSLAGSDKNDTDGIVDGHAYSLIAVKKNVCGQHDLMMFRNPHGKTEFKGEWHDGSVEWQQNPTAAQELNYRSDPNDGLFWISKKDAFRYFQTFSPIPWKPPIGAW